MRKLWMFRPDRASGIEEAARDHGLLSVECGIRGDLRDHMLFDEIWTEVASQNANRPESWISSTARQLHLLLHDIQPGDLIVISWRDIPEISIALARPEVGTDPEGRPARRVELMGTPFPTDALLPDLRHSLRSGLTVCEITRHDALARVESLMRTGRDPGVTGGFNLPEDDAMLEAMLRARMLARIGTNFAGHALADLLAAVLAADGYRCSVAPPGPDGGVDLLAGRGPLGLEQGLVAQVKSGDIVADLPTYHQLKGVMDSHGAPRGLLLSWVGVTRQVRAIAAADRFRIAVWNGEDLLERLLESHDALPLPIRDRLGLRRIWI